MTAFKRPAPPSTRDHAGLREAWLKTAVHKLRPLFSAHGYEIPTALRIACGWPSVGGCRTGKRRIGEAWCSKASRDQHFEIFISPTLDKPAQVLGVLVHELVHVTVGLAAGHKGAFALCARTIGLEGKMTATTVSDPLGERLNALSNKLGPYPHASLDKMTSARKVQKGRLIKVYCPGCQYTIRASMQWILIGLPKCPNADCSEHNQEMTAELPDENGE